MAMSIPIFTPTNSNGNINGNCFGFTISMAMSIPIFFQVTSNGNINSNCCCNTISMAISIPIFFQVNTNVNGNINCFNCLGAISMVNQSIVIEAYQYKLQCQLFQWGIINCQWQYQYLKNVNTNGSSILLLMSDLNLGFSHDSAPPNLWVP